MSGRTVELLYFDGCPSHERLLPADARVGVDHNGDPKPLVEIAEVADNVGLVIVGPTQALRRIPFLHLIEMSPKRFLLALSPRNDFETLELAIADLLDDLPNAASEERQLVSELLSHIKKLRRSNRMTLAHIVLVQMGSSHR